jgi:hypothetical protein
MKAQFIVTIEGDWLENDKPVTAAMMERRLREKARDIVEFLDGKATVKRCKPVGAQTNQEGK